MSTRSGLVPPPSLLVWSINDIVIEDSTTLDRQFDDIRTAGFGGVAVFVRCSRYSWDDEPARNALRRIGELCKRHCMDCWLGLDPRFISHLLVQRGEGLELVMFGEQSRANVVPNVAAVVDGMYSVRCAIPPRHVHTLTDVAIVYAPLGIVRVYAFRAGTASVSKEDIIDVTSEARFFYNARDGYVEAFGRFPVSNGGSWSVLGFFRFKTNHVDFSDVSQIRFYLEKLRRLKREGISMHALMWDEPGFTCTFGSLPYSTSIRRTFSNRTHCSLDSGLWKLALDARDGSHTVIRNQYYSIVQELLNDAQIKANKQVRRLWREETIAGIHDTWHFESADMCDMNHGSLDLWRALKTKSGGFVDLGGIDQLRDPDSHYYANLAAMSVIAASLGRWSERGFAVNNLWTVGDDDGEGWQCTVMDHCVNTMALFGTRWLAHAYGPVGTIGEERSFLGSPPLPGYPDHSTWKEFPRWNRFLEEHVAMCENRLPEANLLVVYPVRSFYALADQRADAAALQIFRLILALVDLHYHIEVISESLLSKAKWTSDVLRIDSHKYEGVLYPYPTVVNRKVFSLLQKNKGRFHCAFANPEWDSTGTKLDCCDIQPEWTVDGVISLLELHKAFRCVEAPANSWVSITRVHAGMMVCLSPSRHGYSYEGLVSYQGQSIELGKQKGLTRILFSQNGPPRIVDSSTLPTGLS